MNKPLNDCKPGSASLVGRRQTLILLGGTMISGALGIPHKSAKAQSNCPTGTYRCANHYCCSSDLNCCQNDYGVPTCCNPPLRCCNGNCLRVRFCPSDKETFKKAADQLAGIAAGCALGALGTNVILRGAFVACAAVTGFGAWKYSQFNNDPPDSNYAVIIQAFSPSLRQQPFSADDGITERFADALNALLENYEDTIGLSTAILTSINRADGARDAGDEEWEMKQLEAAQKYSLELGGLTEAQPRLFAEFINAYQEAEYPNVRVAESEVIAFQERVRTEGLPLDFKQALTELGADTLSVDKIRQHISNLEPNQIVAIADKFPNQIFTPSLTAVLWDAADTFRKIRYVGDLDSV